MNKVKITYVPSNALELFDTYKNYYQKDETPVSLVSKTKMALIRCVVPALGGPKTKAKRLTQNDIKSAMSFLEGVSLDQLFNSVESVRTFMKEETFPKVKQREYWTLLKKLMTWATEQEYISKQLNIVDKPSDNSSFYTKGEIGVKGKHLNVSGKPGPPKYTLGCHYGDYITFALHEQLEDYRKFLIEERGHCHSIQSTVDENLRKTNLLLGWLHRQKNVPLDSLSLESIVPLLKTKPNRADFKSLNSVFNNKAYSSAKRTLEQQAIERREETILLVKSFIDEHSNAVTTRVNDLVAIINVAKFIYKNETNTKVFKNFEDIEIIELLRKVRRDELNKSKIVRVSRSANILSWEKVLKILYSLKNEVDTEFNYSDRRMTKPRKDSTFTTYKQKYKRSDYAIACNLQTFLIIAFVVLLPPNRQQIIADMHIGINLRKGIIAKEKFIAQENTNNEEYNLAQAMWYQYIGDYKSLDFHSDYWARVPNFNFGDKTLYDYIDNWLENYRTVLLKGKSECDFLFIDVRTGKRMNTKFLWNLVRERFQHFVGISVNPQTLLHSYTTHLETVAAPPEVKKAAAEWMNYKDETAKNFYLQVLADKVEPALQYNEQMVKDYFSDVCKTY